MYKLPADLSGLLRSEWETIIEEAGFDEVDEGIVRDCLMFHYTKAYAATGVDRHRNTISRRFPYVVNRVREVAVKLNMVQK